MGETRELAKFVSELRYEDIPAEVIQKAKTTMADSLAGGIAGTVIAKKECKWIKDTVDQFGGKPETTLWIDGSKTSALMGALCNGTMMHTVDYDDTYYRAVAHIGSAVFATAMALGEAHDASGKDLITAYVAGFEAGARGGNSVNYQTHTHSTYFHTTAPTCTIAAGATAARIMNFDEDQTERCLGLSIDQAQGFRACLSQGDFTKSLHCGWPAMRGVMASTLVGNGSTAPRGLLENPQGFCNAMSSDPRLDEITRGLGTIWELMGDSIKMYPSIGCGHTAVETVATIFREQNLKLDDVESVHVRITYLGPGQGAHKEFHTPMQARLSMAYACATEALTGHILLTDYTDSAIDFERGKPKNPEIEKLMEMIVLEQDPSLNEQYPDGSAAEATIVTKDGKKYQSFQIYPRGCSPQRPATDEELYNKFIDVITLVWSKEKAEKVYDMFLNLENYTVKEIVAAIIE